MLRHPLIALVINFHKHFLEKLKSWLSNSWGWGISLLFVVSVVAFWPMFLGQTLALGDNFSLMVPGKLFTVQWLQQGILPLWNPYLFAGISWIGDINQSIFYPTTVLFAVLPATIALNITVFFHVIFAGLGTFLLVFNLTKHKGSAAIAAMLFAFSTQMVGTINNISTVQSLAFLPWIVWAALPSKAISTRFFLSVTFISLQVLAGYPQHLIYSLVFAAVLSLVEMRSGLFSRKVLTQWLLFWVTVGVASLAVTTVVWLPFLDVLSKSTREIQQGDQASVGSLHPLELIKMIIPSIFEYPRGGMKWGLSWNKTPNVSLFMTWFVLVALIILAWSRQIKIKTRHLALIALFSLGILLALGKYVPGYEVISQLPILGAMRGPSIALMLSTLAGSVLIGEIFSQENLVHRNPLLKRVIKFLLYSGVLGVALLISHFLFFTHIWYAVDGWLGNALSESTFHTLERDFIIVTVIGMSLTVNALATAVSLWLWRHQLWTTLVLVVGLTMVINLQGHYLFTEVESYDQQFISNQGKFFVMYSPSSRTLIRNYNAPYSGFDAIWEAAVVREPFSDSYISTNSSTELNSHLSALRFGLTPDWNQVAQVPTITGFTTLLPQDVHERFGSPDKPSLNNLPEIEVGNPLLKDWSLRWYLVDRFYPRYEGEPNYPVVAQNERWTLYELPFTSRFRFENQEAAPYWDYQENPNRFEITVNNKEDQQWFILADRYDQAWQAWVNGAAVPVQNWQGMRAVPIGPDENTILMKYQPWQWRVGLQVSLVSLAAYLLVWVYWHRRSRLVQKSG